MEGLAEAHTHLCPSLTLSHTSCSLSLLSCALALFPPHPFLSLTLSLCLLLPSLSCHCSLNFWDLLTCNGMSSKIILLAREHYNILQNELAKKSTSFCVAALAFRAATRCASLASQHRKCWGFFTCRVLTVHCFSFGVLLLGLRYFLSQAFGEPLNYVVRRHV